MAIASGFYRFLAWKAQTVFGTKATGLAKTMVNLRGGSTFRARPFRRSRGTVTATIPSVANYFDVPKFVEWSANIELVNPRTANDTVRDFLRCGFGRETVTTVTPFTKVYDVFDPIIDGGTDTSTVLYGRALTLHEQADKADGTAIFAHEIQDAVVSSCSLIWEPEAVLRMEVSGIGSKVDDGQSDLATAHPTTGGLHTWAEARNTANSGCRIGTANPPVAADNVVAKRVTFKLDNSIRYENFLGGAATQEARLPVRGGFADATLEVVMDVEDSVASQFDSTDAFAAFVDKTGLNLDLLSYISTTEILEIKASAATAAMLADPVEFSTPGEGPMEATVRLKIAPAALGTDFFIKITTTDA